MLPFLSETVEVESGRLISRPSSGNGEGTQLGIGGTVMLILGSICDIGRRVDEEGVG